MITRFQLIPVVPSLRNYVQRIFVIETAGRFPSEDLKLIVPNACAKLVIPFKNGLCGKTSEWTHLTPQNSIGFIGISDIPAIVDYAQDAPGGTITIEFSPAGTYRFFELPWKEIRNQIYHYGDMLGSAAKALEQKLGETEDVLKKVAMIQAFLAGQLQETEDDPILDHCVHQILRSNGTVKVSELERYTGYSSRWLNMKFQEKIGLSPKNLASVIRFQQYYKALVSNTELFFLQKEFYNYYHDQSHFIRDFKRFTGHSPVLLSRAHNHYDRVFYKD